MARKPGTAHVVDDDWRNRVEVRLKELGISRADLARESKLPKATISELLNGDIDSCVDLPRIHKALGWSWNPAAPLVSKDAGELLGIWDHLDDFDKGRLLERARSLYEQRVSAVRGRG